jgi:SAM-dependent methyltransferase
MLINSKNLNKDFCPLCQSKNISFDRPYGKINFLSCTSIYKCKKCELNFAHELPSKEDLNKYYSSGLYYDRVGNPQSSQILDFSLKLSITRVQLIKKFVKQNFDVLKAIDVGAGSAIFGLALKKYYNNVIYDTIEPDSQVQKNISNWINHQYLDIIDVNENDYELVIMNQVLEHVPDPIDFLNSLRNLLKNDGYIYIDVPYKDFLFKPSIEPHLLFWNEKSLKTLLNKVGFELIFYSTAGMPHPIAKNFFYPQTFFQKIQNFWLYAAKINRLLNFFGLPEIFDTFKQFQADCYNGDRQWIRCLAIKR